MCNFYQQKSKEEELKCFREKLMKNEEEKTLKKSWKNWTARSTCNSRLAGKIRLSVKSHLARNLTQRAGQAQREKAHKESPRRAQRVDAHLTRSQREK